MRLLAILGPSALFPLLSAAASWIVPGAVWYDTNGVKIDAHGGGVVKVGSTFYWVGHSLSNLNSATPVTPWMYSSTDLLNWRNLGQQAAGVSYVWRPKIAKPSGSSSYWIYGQQDRSVLSLRSSTQSGGYGPVAKVLTPPYSLSYSDTGMFYDEASATWYILTSADGNLIQINAINPDGTVGNRVARIGLGELEAPGIFSAGGVYFLIASDKTGYRPNPNKVFWATSLAGPWSGGTDIAPPSQNTYNSQNTHELTIGGSQRTTYIYMGDAWDATGGVDSNYMWLPMNVNTAARTVTLQYYSMWRVDVNTGVVSYPVTKKRYEAKDAALLGRASKLIICSRNSSVSPSVATSSRVDRHAEPDGHLVQEGREVVFRNVTGTRTREYMTIHYTVTNPADGEAHIYVNDETVPTNISALNLRAGYHGSVPVPLTLRSGDVNTIRFGVSGSPATIRGIEFHE